mgnify:CR=1 FL=1
MKLNLSSLLKIVADSTESEKHEVNFDSSMNSLDGWDSLGHISILSKLDIVTDGKASEIDTLADCKSVKDLIKSLKSKSLYNEEIT